MSVPTHVTQRAETVEAPRRRRVLVVALAVGIAGALLTVLGALLSPQRTLAAYLVAYAWGLWTVLGALMLAALGALTRARWLDAYRQTIRAVLATLPLFTLLFVPLSIGVELLYPWAGSTAGLDAALAARTTRRGEWLNVAFWLVRAAVYFAVWLLLAWRLGRAAGEVRDAHGEELADQRTLGAGALAAIALTATLAAVDWLMSLAPHWASAAFGPYVLASGTASSVALAALLAWAARGSEPPTERAEHVRRGSSVGYLLLGALLVCLWLGFSQYLIIWSADLPVEVVWLIPRIQGGWGALILTVILLGGVLPVLLLLVRELHRRLALLALLGAWVLLLQWLHMAWLVLPALRPDALAPHWADLTALMAVAGLSVAAGVLAVRRA